MGQIKATLPDEVERGFKEFVKARYGRVKGSLSIGVKEAVERLMDLERVTVDVEETRKRYLHMLEVRRGERDEIEHLVRFFLDKEEQALKDLEVVREELQRRKELVAMYRELVEEAKRRLETET